MSNAKKFPPQVYTKDEINRILMACGDDRVGLRNQAIIMLGYRCGLRCSEALAVHKSDIAPDHVYVRHGKGGKSRRIGLPDDAAECVRIASKACQNCADNVSHTLHNSAKRVSYMIHSPAANTPDWAFPTSTGRKLQTSYIRNLFRGFTKRGVIHKRLHFHGLRHTFAWELAGEGVPMPIIQRALGHSSLNTTAIYLDHLAPHDVINATRYRA